MSTIPDLSEREFPVNNKRGKLYWHVLGGTFEESKDKFENDLEDERKLFYVAVTGRSKIYISLNNALGKPLQFLSKAAKSESLSEISLA